MHLNVASLRYVRNWLELLADSSAVIQVMTHQHLHPTQQPQHQEGLRPPTIASQATLGGILPFSMMWYWILLRAELAAGRLGPRDSHLSRRSTCGWNKVALPQH
jgi:hypothetical protein